VRKSAKKRKKMAKIAKKCEKQVKSKKAKVKIVKCGGGAEPQSREKSNPHAGSPGQRQGLNMTTEPTAEVGGVNFFKKYEILRFFA